jgi:hypothetical protein
VRDELYAEILELLLDRIGYKCQPSELEELSTDILDKIREVFSDELL